MSRRYVHVLRESGRHFREAFRAWQAMAAHSCGQVVMEAVEGWSSERPEWQDPNNVVILWWSNTAWEWKRMVPPRRKAGLVLWYLESACAPEKLCPMQRGIFEGFRKNLAAADLVLACTPTGAEEIRPFCRDAAFAPIGYDPQFMGKPDWGQAKEFDLGMCLGITGRRTWIMPPLIRRFGSRILDALGLWYGDLRRAYDRCRAELYVAHSDEPSFPGMRIWHAAAASAVLVTEKRDAWPAQAGRHYIEVPEAREDDPEAFVDAVERALKEQPIEEIARRCHEELSAYTPERSMEYIIGALE